MKTKLNEPSMVKGIRQYLKESALERRIMQFAIFMPIESHSMQMKRLNGDRI